MNQWHVQIGDKQYGPIGEDVLRQWIAEGRLLSTHFVWQVGSPAWVSAAQAFGADFAQPSASFTPPSAVVATTLPVVKADRGVLILVFGILSFFVCIIFGILAWVWGNNDLLEMQQGIMDRRGESLTRAGRILGMISVILAIIAAGIWLVAVLFMVAFGGAVGGLHSGGFR